MKKFVINDAIRYAWEVFVSDVKTIIAVFLIYIFLPLALSLLASPDGGWVSFIVSVLNIALSLIMAVGIIKITLNYTYNKESNIGDLFAYASYAPKMFLASLLYGLAVTIGFLLLIYPGIYIGIKYSQFAFFLVDKDMSIMDSFKFSGIITKDAKNDLFVFFLLYIGVSILSVITVFLGMIIILPLYWIASAFIYRELVRNTPDLQKIIDEYYEVDVE